MQYVLRQPNFPENYLFVLSIRLREMKHQAPNGQNFLCPNEI